MHRVLLILLLLGATTRMSAAITNVSWEATSKEITLRYNSSSASCTIAATDKDGNTPHDIDTTLFTGSNVDTRNTNFVTVPEHEFILGSETAERAVDGFVYSRALKAASSYTITITCDSDTYTLSASTKTVPLGVTRGEPIQTDPANPGEYLIPSRHWNIAAEKIIDPDTGVEVTFPQAAGVVGVVTKANSTFNLATSSAWSNPNSATSNSDLSASASISGDNTSTLFLLWDYSKYSDIGGTYLTSMDSQGIDYLRVNLSGYSNASNADDRTVQVCLTINSGASCYGDWFDMVLPQTTEGLVHYPATAVVGNTLQFAGRRPLSKWEANPSSGEMTYTASTKTVKFITGGSQSSWTSGTQIGTLGAVLSNPVIDATNTTPIQVRVDGHGLSTGNIVKISGLTSNTAANGTFVVTTVDANNFTLNGSSGNGNFSGTYIYSVATGANCSVQMDVNNSDPQHTWNNGDTYKVRIIHINGITGPDTTTVYTATIADGPAPGGKYLVLTGVACSGTYSGYGDLNKGNIAILRSTVQKQDFYPIASVTDSSTIVLSSGPASDIGTSVTVTVDTSANTFNATGQPFVDGDRVVITSSTSSIPGGLSARTYYTVGSAGSNSFKVKDSLGNYIDLTSTGGGTITATRGQTWTVNPLGILVRKKNTSATPVNIQYATIDYQLSSGFGSGGASGGSVCSKGTVIGPTGKPGNICGLGGQTTWMQTDGAVTSVPGSLTIHEEINSVGQGVQCLGNGGWDQGFTAVNPNLPNRIYCFSGGTDHGFEIIDYVGNWQSYSIFGAANSYYSNYRGSPFIPNCNGYNHQETDPLVVYSGQTLIDQGIPCAKYKVVTNSLKSVITAQSTFNAYKDLFPNFSSADCYSGWSAWWDGTQVKIAIRCYYGYQDHVSDLFIFAVDDVTKAVTLINEIPTWKNWEKTHGSVAYNVYPGYVSFTAHPVGLSTADYVNVDFVTTEPFNGAFWSAYTSADLTTSLGSCSAWSTSAPIQKLVGMGYPVPDGTTIIQGAATGCNTITMYQPCQTALNANGTTLVSNDATLMQTKCGTTGALYNKQAGDLKVGDILLHMDTPSGNEDSRYKEALVVVGVSGTTEPKTYGILRGGAVQTYSDRYAGHASDHTGDGKRVVVWFPYDWTLSNHYPSPVADQSVPGGNFKLIGWVGGHGNVTTDVSVGWNGDGNYGIVSGDLNSRLVKTTPDIKVIALPKFNGKNGPNDIVAMDTHQSYVPGAGNTTPLGPDDYLLDGRVWSGYTGINGTILGGSDGKSVYKWTSAQTQNSYTQLYPKVFPIAARCGVKALRNISGVGSAISDSTPFTFCFSLRDGECRSDAVSGNFYISCPIATQPGGQEQSSGGDQTDKVDLMFGSVTNYFDYYTQSVIDKWDETGRATRFLTRAGQRYRATNSFMNWSVTPNGKLGVGISRAHELVRSEPFTVDMPPIKRDSWDRTKYIYWPMQVPASAGADNAIVEFGYTRYGTDGNTKFYCMDRAENCVAASNQTETDPFWFANDTYTGVPCASGCTIQVPMVGNKVLVYRIKWRSGTTVVKTGNTRVMVTP